MARNLNPRSFIHTIPMFRYALMLLVGIVIASNSGSVFGLREWIVAVCLLVGVALLVNKRHEMTSSVLLLLAIVGVGGMRYSFHAKDAWAVTDDQHCRLGMNIASEPIRRGKVIQFEGIVIDVSAVSNSPVSGDGGQDVSCRMKGRRLYISLLRDTITRRYEALHIGQAIIADVDVSPLKDWHRINSHFDYIRWQKMRGIVGRGFVGIGKWEASAAGFSALGFWETLKLRALVFRQRILERIKTVMPGDEAYAVLTAMALGNKSSLTPELREEYSISGASHILALSGMHLSIIYMLLSFFIRDRKLLYRLLIFIGLWGYVGFVGMPLSVVRAASMLTIWEAVWLAGREQRPLNVFGATLVIMLMSNPESLWDVGFQMSFMAVFAIIVTRPLSQQLMPMSLRLMRKPEEMALPLWKRTRNKMSRGLWYTACVSVAAQLGTAPLSAYYFGRVSMYFLLTNLIVIPCATVIICGAFMLTAIILADIAIGGALSMLAVAAGTMLSAIVTMQNDILGCIAQLPGASIEGVHVTMVQTMASYVMVYALLLVLYRLARVR